MILDKMNEQERKDITALLRQSGSNNKDEALKAQYSIAAALSEPVRQGVLASDTIANIFDVQPFDPSARIEYPVDFYRPDNAADYTAFVLPNVGKIPSRQIDGDFIVVPTYSVGSAIDWPLRYAREARWDIVSRAMEVLEAGVQKKVNDDAWHAIMSAGFARNVIASDSSATAGVFTKKLVSAMKLAMRRGVSTFTNSLNSGKLTDLYVSPEAVEDIRNWTTSEADDATLNKIFMTTEGMIDIFGTKIHTLDELGDNQEYQTYYETIIAALAANNGMASATDLEICIGLDLSKNDAFVMPVREELTIFADDALHREQRQGFYAWTNLGVGVLSNYRVILGSL